MADKGWTSSNHVLAFSSRTAPGNVPPTWYTIGYTPIAVRKTVRAPPGISFGCVSSGSRWSCCVWQGMGLLQPCAPFRPGLHNETFSRSLQFSRVSMVQGLSFVFTKLSRVLTSQFTAVYSYAGCQAAWTKMTTVQLGLTRIKVLLGFII